MVKNNGHPRLGLQLVEQVLLGRAETAIRVLVQALVLVDLFHGQIAISYALKVS